MNELTENDLALISALQIRPRATWTELGDVLGESPRSLNARWHRLHSSGAAWLAAYVPTTQYRPLALIEMDIATGPSVHTLRELVSEPRVVSIEHMTTGRDLLLTVIGSDVRSLSRFVVDRLARIDGVLRIRTHIVTTVHRDGSRWRLGALTPHQTTALGALAPIGQPPAPARTPDGFFARYAPIIRTLGVDARISAADLAARLDRPEPTIRRQLATVLGADVLTFRCEVAQDLTEWSLIASWWLRVPERGRAEAVSRLSSDRKTRLCCSIAGPSNVFVSMWLRNLDEVTTAQAGFESLPGLTVSDLAITLRTAKRIGWVLDADGRPTGEVVPAWLDDLSAGPGTHRGP